MLSTQGLTQICTNDLTFILPPVVLSLTFLSAERHSILLTLELLLADRASVFFHRFCSLSSALPGEDSLHLLRGALHSLVFKADSVFYVLRSGDAFIMAYLEATGIEANS